MRARVASTVRWTICPLLLVLASGCARSDRTTRAFALDSAPPAPAPTHSTRDTLDVVRPTLLGYIVTPPASGEGGDASTAHDDFSFYLAQATPAFRAHGVDVTATPDSAINLRRRDTTITLALRRPGGADVGYWLLRPDAPPAPLGEGVLVDVELASRAGELLAWPSSAASPVEKFYHAYVGRALAGIPDARQLAPLAPYLGDSLRLLLAASRALHDSEANWLPDEKPSFSDGDLFSSLFEGPSRYEVLPADTTHVPYRVPVRLTYGGATPPVQWVDTAVVFHEHGRFVVGDIAFGGPWEFGNRGTLRGMLEQALRER